MGELQNDIVLHEIDIQLAILTLFGHIILYEFTSQRCCIFLMSPDYIRVYGQFCIETIHGRHNGIERLVVCLSEYLPLSCVYRT